MQPRRSLRVQSISKPAVKSTSTPVLENISKDNLEKTVIYIIEESTESTCGTLEDLSWKDH